MTVAQLVQLYAPFAGLMILAGWLGGLSQRVKNLEGEGINETRDMVIRLDEQVKSLKETVEKYGRSLDGVSRQLGNLATGKLGKAFEIGDTNG